MLALVDLNDKNILYISDDTKLEEFTRKYVTKNIENKTFISNESVIFILSSMMIYL
jgi:hypothetical protein